MHRSALVCPVLAAVLLLAGCGGEATTAAAPRADDGTSASAEPVAPTSSQPADRPDDRPAGEPAAGPATTGDGAGGADTTGEVAVREEPMGERVGADPGGKGPADEADPPTVWPAEVVPVHGGRAWAVYLAVGSPHSDWDMHELGETEAYAHFLGYAGSGIGQVGCDQGAAEALGLDPDDHRVAVYFDSAARAQEFVGVYDRSDVGSAQVTTYCLD